MQRDETNRDDLKDEGRDSRPAEEGEQTEQLAETSDETDPDPELARDRQPRPEDAEKVRRSIEKSTEE